MRKKYARKKKKKCLNQLVKEKNHFGNEKEKESVGYTACKQLLGRKWKTGNMY